MRTEEDVLRSLKRYVWLALGDEYEVRIDDEGGTFSRPGAHVTTAAPAEYPNSGRFLTDVLQPFAIYVYPPAGQDAQDGRLSASRASEALFQAFKVGVGPEGYPDRVPLWDYEGITVLEDPVGRGPDYARVTNFTAEPVRDPTDNRLYTVAAQLRLRWRRTTAPLRGGRVVERVDTNLN